MDLKDLSSKNLQKTTIYNLASFLTSFEIQRYCHNEVRFNGVYYRDNLLDKIKDGAFITNLDEYSDIGTDWIALYKLNNGITYFDSFAIEHIPKQIKRFIGNKICKEIMLKYKHMIQ